MTRTNYSSGARWESIVGYSRAVRIGDGVHVSGTIACDEAGSIVGAGDAAAQTRQCLRNIEAVLRRSGATMRDVVRTRIYVVNIDEWEAIGRVHGEFFGDILPVTTMVEVSRLITPEALVEIEADAHIGEA